MLKALNPAEPVIQNAGKLAYGLKADDPAAEKVRIWRQMELEVERLARRAAELGIKSDAEEGNQTDSKAADYWQQKRSLDAWLKDERNRLKNAADFALRLHNAGWFRRIADAIDEEWTADRQDKYPFHTAIMVNLGRLKAEAVGDNQRTISQAYTNAPLDDTPRYTISEACAIMEPYRPHGLSEDDWKRKVRDACGEVGIRLKPSKPGPKPKPAK